MHPAIFSLNFGQSNNKNKLKSNFKNSGKKRFKMEIKALFAHFCKTSKKWFDF
jgi:hypothetical protein